MSEKKLIKNLKELRLTQMSDDYLELARQCELGTKTFEQYLELLTDAEVGARRLRKTKALIGAAKLPRAKSLGSYDFSFRKGISQQQMNRLVCGDFIKESGNVVLYGSFGVGKSHLAEGLTRSLCESGYRCRFMNVSDQISELVEAQQNLGLARLFKKLDRFDVLTLDELGYLTFSKDEADLFFQLISHRYERRSMVITTNLTFSEWDKVFISPLTTMGAVDRMIHRCETFNIEGPSWREKEAKDRKASRGEEEIVTSNSTTIRKTKESQN